MQNICSKGHFSSDPDYCSECGMPMQAAAAGSSASAPSAPRSTSTAGQGGVQNAAALPGNANCPDCMTPRPAKARFCEVCRFDFVAHQSFSGLGANEAAPTAHSTSNPAAACAADASPTTTPAACTQASAAAPVQAAPSAPRLLLRIVVDPALNTDPDPVSPSPAHAPERIFHLDLEENTLGRQYEGNGVHPEIVVQDPGISRRHLKFVRNAAQDFAVLELGSANGTTINAKALEPGVLTPVQPGDQLTLGMWTRIHVQAR
jgi:FHA domain